MERIKSEANSVNIERFLIEAKTQTYANEKGERADSSRLGSKDYEYKNGNMTYMELLWMIT